MAICYVKTDHLREASVWIRDESTMNYSAWLMFSHVGKKTSDLKKEKKTSVMTQWLGCLPSQNLVQTGLDVLVCQWSNEPWMIFAVSQCRLGLHLFWSTQLWLSPHHPFVNCQGSFIHFSRSITLWVIEKYIQNKMSINFSLNTPWNILY